jgi:tetratricopeptide (TPR) repeat protein
MTQGLPREINVVAGQAMLNAYLESAPTVTPKHVQSTMRDYGFEGLRYREQEKEEAKPPAPAETPATAKPAPGADPANFDLHFLPALPPRNERTRFAPAILGIGIIVFLAAGFRFLSRADVGLDSIPPPPLPRETRRLLLSPPPPSEEPRMQVTVAAERAAEKPPPAEVQVTDFAKAAEEPRRVPPSPPPPWALPSTNPSAADRLELGTSLARAGRLDEAIALFREALAIEPRYADAHYNLGLSLLENQKPHEAVDALEAAVSLSPQDARSARTRIALRQNGGSSTRPRCSEAGRSRLRRRFPFSISAVSFER